MYLLVVLHPLDPESPIRCEIIPENVYWGNLYVEGQVWNRTMAPYDYDRMQLAVDKDRNLVFEGVGEVRRSGFPSTIEGEAQFELITHLLYMGCRNIWVEIRFCQF